MHASYDATRELYRIINHDYLAKTGVTVRPSHGGSGRQALAVMEGLAADVVSLAVWPDLHLLETAGMLDAGWESRFENRSLPYTSTIVFVVRKGNPKSIFDWPDLIARDDVHVIAANPKTGGAAKLAVLAAWGAARIAANESTADQFIMKLFDPQRIPILEGSSRTATQTFARKKIGDVHITWESEALLEFRELSDDVEIIRPSVSILAEPHVAVVDANVRRRGTHAAADAYIQNLYGLEAQRTMARLGFRPANTSILHEYQATLPSLRRFSIRDVLPGGWPEAWVRFFDDGALFDRAYHS
jgi:sulfate/thiosulfate transport system substrate-binding protein